MKQEQGLGGRCDGDSGKSWGEEMGSGCDPDTFWAHMAYSNNK